MNKATIVKSLGMIGTRAKKQAPVLAMGAAILCYGCAVVSAVNETPKINKLLEQRREELELEADEKLTVKETAKAIWKPVVKIVAPFVMGTVCIIGMHKMYLTHSATMAAAYNQLHKEYNEYKNKVIENVGDKKEAEIRSAIARDNITNDPPSENEVYYTKEGKTLFKDAMSGRYFRSSRSKIDSVLVELNNLMRVEHFIYLNQFYERIGLPRIDTGNIIGWNLDDCYPYGIQFNPSYAEDPEGEPCTLVQFNPGPTFERYEHNR